jgi:hypothetical protein
MRMKSATVATIFALALSFGEVHAQSGKPGVERLGGHDQNSGNRTLGVRAVTSSDPVRVESGPDPVGFDQQCIPWTIYASRWSAGTSCGQS